MAGIVVKELSKIYPLSSGGMKTALQGVDIEVADGEFLCLLGPSGCGKTTLLNILGGLDRSYQGAVRYTGRRGQAGAHRGDWVLGYVFQNARLLPWLSVQGNVEFVLDGPRAQVAETARFWLERVGLSECGRDYPGELSTGMQQRVAVARAFAVEPDILLMDEPFSSLDEGTGLRMRDELLQIWQERTCTVVFVTHNPLEAVYLADRVLVMSGSPGRIQTEVNLTDRLPRPRRVADQQVWELSRQAVQRMMGDAHGAAGG